MSVRGSSYQMQIRPARLPENNAVEQEDGVFFILKGHLRIELEHGTVELPEGALYVVPKGVRHNPVAEHECTLC
ncbi:cupin domain-containing protein [Hymenobacter sediminis]|uniref:cupin domain-containing protein n=1 Tax=Hymenobacter sediminis TaxID=2218621 RepID=UPI0034DAD24F